MAKMDDESLVHLLITREEDSSSYVWGQLGAERESAMRQYHRLPYGNEEEGWSQVVTSDVQDTVEWILPDLLDVFCTTDEAVVFEPTKPGDEKGAQQATQAVNYVFHKRNNGFLTLYTAFKDALIVRNGCIMWRKETKSEITEQPFNGASAEMLAMLQQGDLDEGMRDDERAEHDSETQPDKPEFEIIEATPREVMGPMGPTIVFDGRLKKTEEVTKIKVEAFEPENLLIARRWNSPLLQDCPYVCRMMQVTLSELHEMGFDSVTSEELAGSDGSSFSADQSFRLNRVGQSDAEFAAGRQGYAESADESQTEGWLRIEFVRVDYDGDGIAELRCIYRVNETILSNEPCNHIPIATASPILNTHRWDGMSIADIVSDLQVLHTELMRQTLNSLYLSNNPRTKVLTDANWSPLANIDDLLDSRPGGIIRQRDMNAVSEHVTPFTGQQSFPMLEYVQGMREARTGVTRYNQGMDADSLNKTASGIKQIKTAGQQRIKLIARIFAETLLKPCMQGILKLLTDGGMQRVSMRLRGEFVEYDPNEWRDQYDTTINVGLGSGDREIQSVFLNTILAQQLNLVQGGMGSVLVTEKNIYTTLSKMVENAGYKNVGEFWTDPSKAPKTVEQKKQEASQAAQAQFQQQAQLQMQTIQAKAQADMQLAQMKAQIDAEMEKIRSATKLQEHRGQLELQATNDDRDAQRELMKAEYEAKLEEMRLQLDKYKVDHDNATRLVIAQLGQVAPVEPMMQQANMVINAQAGML